MRVASAVRRGNSVVRKIAGVADDGSKLSRRYLFSAVGVPELYGEILVLGRQINVGKLLGVGIVRPAETSERQGAVTFTGCVIAAEEKVQSIGELLAVAEHAPTRRIRTGFSGDDRSVQVLAATCDYVHGGEQRIAAVQGRGRAFHHFNSIDCVQHVRCQLDREPPNTCR